MHALSHALSRASKAGKAVLADRFSPASLSRLTTAAAGVQQAAQTAQADPPPACVPALASDESAATSDFAQEAQGQLDEVHALQNNQIPTALADIRATARSVFAGVRALRATVADINSFNAG
jgi:hypothetical protein